MRFTVLKAVCLMSSFLLYACAHNLEKRPMEEFLVGYDYGMGGLWYYIKAKSREDILREYPDVGIWSNPAFFDQQYLDHIKTNIAISWMKSQKCIAMHCLTQKKINRRKRRQVIDRQF